MKRRSIARAVAALAFLACAAGAGAQTLYKLVDRNGKVTYSETAPKDFDGKVTPMNIDPNANTATLAKPAPAEAAPAGKAQPPQPVGIKPRGPADFAREKAEKARRQYEQARDNPADSDYEFLGNVGGGTRRVHTSEYKARLAALEQAMRKAEEEAKRAEGAR